MRRVASLLTVGIGVVMLMGTAIPSSSAATLFTCNNSGSSTTNSVICTGNDLGNNVGNVTISNIQSLSNNQLSVLDGTLNAAFNVASVNLQDVQVAVLNLINNVFNIPVTLQQIQVCTLSNCT